MTLQCSSSWFIAPSCSQGEGRPISKWALIHTGSSSLSNPAPLVSVHLHYRDADGTHSGNEERQTCMFYTECKGQMKPLGRASLRFFEVLNSLSAVMCMFLALIFLIYEFWQLRFFIFTFILISQVWAETQGGCVCVCGVCVCVCEKKGKNIININVTKYPHPSPHTKRNMHTAHFTSVLHLIYFNNSETHSPHHLQGYFQCINE